MKSNCNVIDKSKQKSAKQRNASGKKANLQNVVLKKINTRQKPVNQYSTLRASVMQSTKSQENTSQEAAPQVNALPINIAPGSTQLKGTVNRELLQKRIEPERKMKKEYSSLQHSDDEEQLKNIEEIVDIIEDNGFDENFLKEHLDCSKSSIRRILFAWMDKPISKATIFNMTMWLSINSVFVEYLQALLVNVVKCLISNGGVVHCRILSPSKVVIEIDFSKNKSLCKENKDGKKEKLKD